MARVYWAVLFAALGVVYYYAFGPAPSASELASAPWWQPRGLALSAKALGWLRELSMLEGSRWRFVPVALFALPPLVLAALGFRVTRSALARAAGVALALSLLGFVWSGYLAAGPWLLFGWRWPLVILGLAAISAAALFAPSLLREARRLPLTGQVAVALAALALVYLPSVELTGTDRSGPAGLSLWPLLPVVGLLVVGRALGVVHVALAGVTWLRGRMRASASPTAATRALAGILLLVAIGFSNWSAGRGQAHVRDQVAQTLIDALERYKSAHGEYPEKLAQLVPAELAAVPRAKVGVLPRSDARFGYTSYGDSYSLEFASVQWVQCAYSPPYAEDEQTPPVGAGAEADADAAGEGDSLAGSWTCSSAPPRLW